jgi:hypothetical protein
MERCVCLDKRWGLQDIQSRVESGHTGGKEGDFRTALLFEMLGDALAMGRDLVRANTFPSFFFVNTRFKKTGILGRSFCTPSRLPSMSRS